MTTMRNVAFLSCILIAGSAMAQDAAKRAEEQRQSSEMMKPPTNAPAGARIAPAPPLSEAERKAEDARKASEAMMPQTRAPAAASQGQAAAPVSEADRRAAEARARSEAMKPQ